MRLRPDPHVSADALLRGQRDIVRDSAWASLAGSLSSGIVLVVRWTSPLRHAEVAVFDFQHWEFLFALSALLGLYVLHALSRVDEGEAISERQVMQAFALEALRTVNHLSSIGGVLGTLFPFRRLAERRKRARAREP